MEKACAKGNVQKAVVDEQRKAMEKTESLYAKIDELREELQKLRIVTAEKKS